MTTSVWRRLGVSRSGRRSWPFPDIRESTWAGRSTRAFGSAALDMCGVAEGMIDAYTVVGRSALGSWDYLGAMLVCTEAGACVQEVDGLDLVTTGHTERRSVAAAATPALLTQVVERAKAARPSTSDGSGLPGVPAAAD